MSLGIHGGFWQPGQYGIEGEAERLSDDKIRITITCLFPNGNVSGRIRQGSKPDEFIFETKMAGCIMREGGGLTEVSQEFEGDFADLDLITLLDSDGENEIAIE